MAGNLGGLPFFAVKVFLVYRAKDGVRADLRVEGETFWATQAQMAMMFGVDQSGISRHVSNIFAEGELSEEFAMQKMHSSKGGNPPGIGSAGWSMFALIAGHSRRVDGHT